MNTFTPQIRPASDFAIKRRPRLLDRLRALWNYDPVAMQKAMLREVWVWRLRNRRAMLDLLSQPLADFARGIGRDPSSFAPISLGSCRSFQPRLMEPPDTRTGADWAKENAEYERNFKRIMEDFP